MSVQEFKAALDRMDARERAEVAAHLRILQWKETAALAETLAAAHSAMDAGKKITQEEVEAFVATRGTRKP